MYWILIFDFLLENVFLECTMVSKYSKTSFFVLLVQVYDITLYVCSSNNYRHNFLFYTIWQTTFILKRKNKIELHKTPGKMRPMKARHFVYELVEDTNVRKKDPVKLILTKPVEGKWTLCDILVWTELGVALDYEI